MNSKAKHPQSRHTGKKAELDNKGFIEFVVNVEEKQLNAFYGLRFAITAI